MPTRRKESQSNWRFAMEHLGRELRKLYPPTDTPPGLRALFTDERQRASAAHQNDQSEDSEDDGNPK